MMADENKSTLPVPRQNPDIPPHVQEFLSGLDREETELLSRLLKAMLSMRLVSKILVWAVAGILAAVILASQTLDAIRNLLPPHKRFALILAAAISVVLVSSSSADDKPHHSNPWLKSWIPATCCVTNDCCWQISSTEVVPMPNDEWRVVSTGQVRKRTDWSPDGKYYRCACDYDQADRKWIRHQGANTRCVFVPMQSAAVLPPR